MRWEILSTKIQYDKAPNQQGWIEVILIRLFAYTLRFYPSAFRADFADEMLSVFAMNLRETSGIFNLLSIAWREVRDLPANVVHARQQAFITTTSSINIWRARQVTRWSSLILSLFMLHSLINPFVAPQTFAVDRVRLSLFFVLLFLTSISMLLAWRWERLGGLMTIVCGIALGCFLVFYIAYFRPVEISWFGLTLIGILWSLPFVTFGILFYQLSQRPTRQMHLA